MSGRNLFLVVIAIVLGFLHAATITWTGSADSNFLNLQNWNTKTIPTALDNVILLDKSVVTLDRDITVLSLRISSGASLTVRGTLSYVSGITIDSNSKVLLDGGNLITNTAPVVSMSNFSPSVSYPTVTVSGELVVLKGEIAGAIPQASGTIEYPSVMIINSNGKVITTGGSISNTRVMNSGVLEYNSQGSTLASDLALKFTAIEVGSGGTLNLSGVSLSTDNSVANRASFITVSGDGKININNTNGTLQLKVPVTIGESSTLTLQNGQTQVLADMAIEGRVDMRNNAILSLSSTNHVFGSKSSINISNNSSLLTVAGHTLILGTVNTVSSPTGTIIVRAPLSLTGATYVANLQLQGGNVIIGDENMDTTAESSVRSPIVRVSQNFNYESGNITGAGKGDRTLTVTNTGGMMVISKSTKGLNNVNIILQSTNNLIQEDATIVMVNKAKFTVNSGAVLTMANGSSLAGDEVDDGSALVVNDNATLTVVTGKKIATIDVNAVINGKLNIIGDEANTMSDNNVIRFNKPSTIDNLDVVPVNAHVKLVFNPVFVPTSTNYVLPNKIKANNLDMSFGNVLGKVDKADWTLKNIQLLKSNLQIKEGTVLVRDSVILGDNNGNSAAIMGGHITAQTLIVKSGSFTPVSAIIDRECVNTSSPTPTPTVTPPIPSTNPPVTHVIKPEPVLPATDPVSTADPAVFPAESVNLTPNTMLTDDAPGQLTPLVCPPTKMWGINARDLAWIWFAIAMALLVLSIILAIIIYRWHRHYAPKNVMGLESSRNSRPSHSSHPSSITMSNMNNGQIGNVRR